MTKKHYFLIIILLGLLFVPTTALASSYKSPNDAIEKEAGDGFALDSKDVSSFESIMSFLRGGESYIYVRKTDTGPIYFFNTPNVPLNAANMFQNLNKGGWAGSFCTTQPKEGATDALKRYGYINPDYVYLGERPIVFLSIDQIVGSYANIVTGAKIVISFTLNFFASLFGGEFQAEVAKINPTDLWNLSCANEDYVDFTEATTASIGSWLEKVWDKFPEGELSKIEVGDEKLDSITDGKKVGSGEGELNGESLLQNIIEKAGNNYLMVLNALIEYTQEHEDDFKDIASPVNLQIRHMPYDLESMSPSSKGYMQNIVDPRVEMFGSTFLLGFFSTFAKQFMHLISNQLLSWTAWLCSTAGLFNSICDLNLLKANGIDPTMAWTGAISVFLISLLLIISILSIATLAVDVLRGNKSGQHLIARAFGSTILTLLVVAALAAPGLVSTFISNTATSIMSLGTLGMQADENFQQYYVEGQSTQADISELRYWYAYHNCWAQYVTGHAVAEDANSFNPNQLSKGENEYKSLDEADPDSVGNTYSNPAKLATDKRINNWSAVLLDNLENNNTKAAYRAVDHFMAPTIIDGDYPSFSVSKNPYYDGVYMFSNTPWAGVGLAIILFGLTLLKVMCFIGFLIDFMLLLVKFAFGALNLTKGGGYVRDTLQTMLDEIIKVAVYDMLITFVIYCTSSLANAAYNWAVLLLFIAFILLVRKLYKDPDFILAPAVLRPLKKGIDGIKNKVLSVAGVPQDMVQARKEENSEYNDRIKELKKDIKNKKVAGTRKA